MRITKTSNDKIAGFSLSSNMVWPDRLDFQDGGPTSQRFKDLLETEDFREELGTS